MPRILAAIVALALVVTVVGCTASAQDVTQAPEDGPRATADAATSPISQGETVTVGPYEMSLVRADILTGPETGPDLPAISPIPDGYDLADVGIRVFNPSALEGNPAGAPFPDMEGFSAQFDANETTSVAGVGLSRGSAAVEGWGTTETSEPLAPGESVTIYPQFGVPPGTETVTLLWRPLPDRPDLVAVFRVR